MSQMKYNPKISRPKEFHVISYFLHVFIFHAKFGLNGVFLFQADSSQKSYCTHINSNWHFIFQLGTSISETFKKSVFIMICGSAF